MAANYVTVDEIVKDALIDIGDNTEHLYMRCLHWALKGVKDFALDASKDIKTVSIRMNPNKTIDLPVDLVNYSKVGVLVGDRIRTFLVNENIELRHDVDECGNPLAKETTDVLDFFPFYQFGYIFYNFNGGYLNGFGGTCQTSYFCRLDRGRNQIVFGSEVPTTDVYLEYITNGINPSGLTTVSPLAQEQIKLYVLYQRKKNSDRYSLGEKQMAENDYYREVRQVKKRLHPFDIQDFIASTRRGYLEMKDRFVNQGRISIKTDAENGTSTTTTTPVVEEPCDTFPIDDPETAPLGFKKIYWGSKASPLIDTSSEILTLNSEFFENRLITKTFNPNPVGGEYIYFAIPVAYGTPTFKFNNFTIVFLEEIVSDFEDTYGAEPYGVYRSNQLQHGENLIFEIQ